MELALIHDTRWDLWYVMMYHNGEEMVAHSFAAREPAEKYLDALNRLFARKACLT